jgi:hypothetical protein
VKSIRCCFFSIVFLLLGLTWAHAQSAAFYMGLGSNYVKSNGFGISTADSTFLEQCAPSQDANCSANPNLGSVFLGFGGEAMLNSRYGINAEVSFQPVKQDFGPLRSKQIFYDFNAIYSPVSQKRVGLKLLGGFGGSRTSFSYKDTSCAGGTVACSSTVYSIGKSNHFQLHAGVGVDIMLKGSLMMRPQFDLRYVPNFSDQYGRDIVTGGMVWIGFRVNNR